MPALSITPANLAHSIFIPSLFHHAIQCQISWSENTSTETVFTLRLLIAYQEKMQLLLLSVGFLSPLDRCIIRVMLKKKPQDIKISSIYLVSCRLCNGYCSPPSPPQPCCKLEALKWMNTYPVAFVVYKTPGQKHCLTDLLHCPSQRWNPRDRILDPICKTGKLINS